MTDSTIKIYNARYSKLMKLLDFIAVNLFIFAYLKYFFVEPSTASLFLGIIYSLIFIRANEHFQLYSGQFKGQYLKKLTKLFFSVSISGLLSFLLFVSAELLLNNHASTNAVRLAEIIVLCSIAIFIREGANKQVISSQADSLIKISRIWADFFPANTSNQPI